MGSKERILRQKEETRCNILQASLQIAREEGWQAMSLRKIAERIEYTAPIVYEYFSNKEAILLELATQGYAILARKVKEARDQHDDPAAQLEAMWLSYWDFAFEEKELYQLMFGVKVEFCTMSECISQVYGSGKMMIMEVIARLMGVDNINDERICKRYYTFWSVIHGLVSINIVRDDEISDQMNKEVLADAVRGIILAIQSNRLSN